MFPEELLEHIFECGGPRRHHWSGFRHGRRGFGGHHMWHQRKCLSRAPEFFSPSEWGCPFRRRHGGFDAYRPVGGWRGRRAASEQPRRSLSPHPRRGHGPKGHGFEHGPRGPRRHSLERRRLNPQGGDNQNCTIFLDIGIRTDRNDRVSINAGERRDNEEQARPTVVNLEDNE
ncbi:hypothetical protein GWI33_001539 [Rhynchophorus ferrugineus]|uniref:Uncharacterized protein n=1 Tax=Rhynchophorus ferrugineus TaxID=354439 RepID=A0A834HY55_RHYFE|nr:hypothetical protein GWI33_001539 [Rhynchophorus ferrugineus]